MSAWSSAVLSACVWHDRVVVGLSDGVRIADGPGETWRPLDGPWAAASLVSLVAPCVERLLVATTGALHLHDDAAGSWTTAPLILPSTIVTSFAAIDKRTALIGTLEDGVFRTTDGGQTWLPANAGLIDPSVTSLAAHGDLAIVGTSTGAYVSSNGGRTWRDLDRAAGEVASVALRADDRVVWLLRASGELVRTDPVTNARTVVASGLDEPVALAADGRDVILATASQVLRSRDDGRTWEPCADRSETPFAALACTDFAVTVAGEILPITRGRM